MPVFLQLTTDKNTPIWINMARVDMIVPGIMNGPGSIIRYGHGEKRMYVQEPPEEILQMLYSDSDPTVSADEYLKELKESKEQTDGDQP